MAKSAEAPVLRVVRRACQACQSLLARSLAPRVCHAYYQMGPNLYGLVLKFRMLRCDRSK